MTDKIRKTIPNELDSNSRYAVRVRSINAFGTPSDWSESLIVNTVDSSSSTSGRLVLTANGMIAYDSNGQTKFVYSGDNVGSRTNLVKNPSFEIGTTGWTATVGASISRTTSDFYVGADPNKAALKVTATTKGTLRGVNLLAADRVVVGPGDRLTVSAYVKALASIVALKIGLSFYDSGNSLIKTDYSTPVTVGTTEWSRISNIDVLVPNSTAKVDIAIVSDSEMAVSQAYLIDGVLFEESSTLGDYFDGSTSIGATKWTGTANYSTSTFDLTSAYYVDGGVFTSGTIQTAVDVGEPYLPATPTYGKPGVKMSTAGIQGYSGDQATPSFSLDTQGKFRVGNLSRYMYWNGTDLFVKGGISATDFNLLNASDTEIASLGPISYNESNSDPGISPFAGSVTLNSYTNGLTFSHLASAFGFSDSGFAWTQSPSSGQAVKFVIAGPTTDSGVVSSTNPFISMTRNTSTGLQSSSIYIQPGELKYLVGAANYVSGAKVVVNAQANTADASDFGRGVADIFSWTIPPSGTAGGGFSRVYVGTDHTDTYNYVYSQASKITTGGSWVTNYTLQFIDPDLWSSNSYNTTNNSYASVQPGLVQLKTQDTAGTVYAVLSVDTPNTILYTQSAVGVYSQYVQTSTAINMYTNGTLAINITSAQRFYVNSFGTESAPSISFQSDSGCGLYRNASTDIRMVGGSQWGLAVINGVGFASETVTTSTITWRDGGFGAFGVPASNLELKNNINEMDGDVALDVIRQLKPVTFYWNAFESDSAEVAALRTIDQHAGFVAEWMEEVDAPFSLVDHRPPKNLPKIPELRDDMTDEELAEREAIQLQVREILGDLNNWEVGYWKEPHMIATLTAAVKKIDERLSKLEGK